MDMCWIQDEVGVGTLFSSENSILCYICILDNRFLFFFCDQKQFLKIN